MKERLKYFFTILLVTIIICASSTLTSNAATNQLIIINSKNNTLNFYENNILVKSFKCATGKSSTPTPERKTTIVNKIKNRPYYKGNIPGGDPKNPLGKRWMGLNMYGYGTTYGIHGTNNESSIGKNISDGCIRMYNKDVEWLYNKIRIGATVIIKNTSNNDAWILQRYGIKLRNTWNTINGYKYYYKSNGKYATGWYTINNKTYYFDSKGRMQIGLKTISGKKYYLDKDGVRRVGWQMISGKTYYFAISGTKKGQALKDNIYIDGFYYYFDKNYIMITDKKVKIENDYYYFGIEGKMVVNKEQKIENDYYYFGEDGKAYRSCEKQIGKYIYTFNEIGKIVNKEEIKENPDGNHLINNSNDSNQSYELQQEEVNENEE